MTESRREMLSIGVFFIIVVVAIVLYAAHVIPDWTLIFPVVLVFSGCWLLALAAMRASSSQKYERGAFSTMGMGLLLIALGGGWFLFTLNQGLYALALVLLVIGALAIAAALRRK